VRPIKLLLVRKFVNGRHLKEPVSQADVKWIDATRFPACQECEAIKFRDFDRRYPETIKLNELPEFSPENEETAMLHKLAEERSRR
jgi:hypothetical protein